MPFLATASQQGNNATGMLILLLPLALIGLLFWQQRRRQKQMQRAQADLVPGQEVSTTSGLMGRLISVEDQVAEVEAAPGVRLRFDKRAVLPRQTTPAPTEEASQADEPENTPDPEGDVDQSRQQGGA